MTPPEATAIRPDPDFGPVQGEIRFFMERTFQVSFGYVGALVAIAAAVKLEVADRVSAVLQVDTAVLLSCAFVGANAIYLSLAIGTLFAVLKRGLFVLEQGSAGSTAVEWELFVRNPENPFSGGGRRSVQWNLDNFYMIPLFALIAAGTLVGLAVGVTHADTIREVTAVCLAVGVTVVPMLAFVPLLRLTRHCEAVALRLRGRAADVPGI